MLIIFRLFFILIVHNYSFGGCESCKNCGIGYKNNEIEYSSNWERKKYTYTELINLKKIKTKIPSDFIDNNKDRIFKMIKHFKKGLTDEDINEILVLLYNLGLDFNVYDYRNPIVEYIYNKLKVDNNTSMGIVRENVKGNNFFYIFFSDSYWDIHSFDEYIKINDEWIDKCNEDKYASKKIELDSNEYLEDVLPNLK